MEKEKMTKSEWLKINGFSDDGVAYLIAGNSYPIKDALKEAGYKFSPLLRWHGPTDSFILPLDGETWYEQITFDEYFSWNDELGIAFMKEKTRDRLDLLFNPPRETKSDYVGVIGEKIEGMPCTVRNISGYNTAYGYRWVYNFVDENDMEYSWHSAANKSLAAGMKLNISGTIKDHKEYKGTKTTILTRCKINQIH